MMENLPHYRKKYEELKKIVVYFIRSVDDTTSEKVYFYAVANATLHERMVLSLQDGRIPDFAVIVESGYGDPSSEVKTKMKTYYDFDHDLHEFKDSASEGNTSSDAPPPVMN